MNPRLWTIPGCETHPAEAEQQRQSAAVLMALDALSALPPETLCNVVGSHLADRGDVPVDALQRLATTLDRRAWAATPVDNQ